MTAAQIVMPGSSTSLFGEVDMCSYFAVFHCEELFQINMYTHTEHEIKKCSESVFRKVRWWCDLTMSVGIGW